jgi:hypothetical protein
MSVSDQQVFLLHIQLNLTNSGLTSSELAIDRTDVIFLRITTWITGYGMDDRGVGVRVPVGSKILSSPRLPDRLRGPPNLLSNGSAGLFFGGVKRLWREADHSNLSSAKVKKMWIYTTTPPYALME